jgi:hypothetical protein
MIFLGFGIRMQLLLRVTTFHCLVQVESTTFYTSVGYNKKEDIMAFNPAERERMNATLNLQTDVTDWLQVGARLNFTRKHFSRANAWSNIYQYLWRWGSFFIPSGTLMVKISV